MTSELKSNILPPDMVGLPHMSRELTRIVEPGQIIPNRDRIYNLVTGGDLQMIEFIRGRWYCPRSEMPALALALGLQLKEPDQPERSRPAPRRSAASAA